MPAERATVLPDLLAPGLRVVFCGTAPGHRSAAEQAYYAHPGNRFWEALQRTGITPRRYAPAEYADLLALGIGLTDVAKHHAGNDRELPPEAYDAAALRTRIAVCAPRHLAFTSKNAARAALGQACAWGRQARPLGDTAVWVLPSPSGQARGHWDLAPWQALADAIASLR